MEPWAFHCEDDDAAEVLKGNRARSFSFHLLSSFNSPILFFDFHLFWGTKKADADRRRRLIPPQQLAEWISLFTFKKIIITFDALVSLLVRMVQLLNLIILLEPVKASSC